MYTFLLDMLTVSGVLVLLALAKSIYEKAQIESSYSVQCSSGDSEVMTFNYNFKKGERDESKDRKIEEGFEKIRARREENHQEFLRIRDQAIKENEAKDPETMKLRSITEGKATS